MVSEAVRILVPVKPVFDPDLASKIRISADTKSIAFEGELKPNPFDEYALEAALRLSEDGRNTQQRLAEVVVVALGAAQADVLLRAALATGADRAIRITADEAQLDASVVAWALAQVANQHQCDLVLMGKQTADGDGNEVGQRLAEMLGWPQATFVSGLVSLGDGRLEVEREVDGGLQRLRIKPPAVVTIDLRIVSPSAVRSHLTPADHSYPPGVRFASLPAIMRARKKPLEVLSLEALGACPTPLLRHVSYSTPEARAAGRIVSSASELVNLLRNEAKVI